MRFLMVFDFTQFWHPWHPWVCIRSDLKSLETDMSDSSYCELLCTRKTLALNTAAKCENYIFSGKRSLLPDTQVCMLTAQFRQNEIGYIVVLYVSTCLLYCYYSSIVGWITLGLPTIEHYRKSPKKTTTLQILALQESTVGFGERSTWVWKGRL